MSRDHGVTLGSEAESAIRWKALIAEGRFSDRTRDAALAPKPSVVAPPRGGRMDGRTSETGKPLQQGHG
jgi:hypothetical protein